MIFGPNPVRADRPRRNTRWLVLVSFLIVQTMPFTSRAALPQRLVLLVDGVSYRDMKALQDGVTYRDNKGRQIHRQAFHRKYFPVSRLVSTFPSVSDPAWTEILGNRPLPGYQRTYFSASEGSEIYINGVTSSAEFEKQMTWQMGGGFRRIMSYVFPPAAFKYEVNAVAEDFLKTTNNVTNYYAMLHTTDIAQHLSGDIYAMLCALDAKLQELRAIYKAREGKELEILILSDHGNNHAGGGKRVDVRGFLQKGGYRIGKSIHHPKDIVLPTAGIESWIEVHNSPEETENLVQLLSKLEGVDVLTAQSPHHTNRFIVMNSQGERAVIDWNAAKNSFRYEIETGDPINYRPVVEALAKTNAFDAQGFATSEAWFAETLSHQYPLALERIVRGHTQVAQNPAPILVSLKNDYVHCEWLIRRGVALVKSGGTHGGLDHLNSVGIVLSSFSPAKDTSTSRVAAQFEGFKGRRDYRATESGAEWVMRKNNWTERDPQAHDSSATSSEAAYLRIWSAAFARFTNEVSIHVKIRKARSGSFLRIRRADPEPVKPFERQHRFEHPISIPNKPPFEKIYAYPAEMKLDPEKVYWISGEIQELKKRTQIFRFMFRTDANGLPLVH